MNFSKEQHTNNLPLWITEHLRKNSVWFTLNWGGVDIGFDIFEMHSVSFLTSNLFKHTTNICGDLTILLSSSHFCESQDLAKHLLSCCIVLKFNLKFSTKVAAWTGILWEHTFSYFVSHFQHLIHFLFSSTRLRTMTSNISWFTFFISFLHVSITASSNSGASCCLPSLYFPFETFF